MPKCSTYNQFKGLYFRAPENEGPAELTVEVTKETETLEVELYPYKVGKTVWQVYIWNDIGFTKSTEKLVYYNELQVPGKSPTLKNRSLYLVGTSDSGVIT